MKGIPWLYRFYRWGWSGMDLLFPPMCGGCGQIGSRWCEVCKGRVARIREPFCTKCGTPTLNNDICEKCLSNPPVYNALRSWAGFESPVRDALLAVKYHRNIGLADAIATDMLEFVRSLQWMMEILIPVPSGAARLRERGYNQVALIARPLAYELGVAYAPNGLRRARETRSQVGLNVSERRENVRGAYRADPSVVERKSILLMDDVATTGATISACAEALVAAGATEVRALTVARAHTRHDLNRV